MTVRQGKSGAPMPSPGDRERDPAEHEERFRELFERHSGEAFRYFVRKGFSYEDSRELTQEAFLRVYQGLNEFRGDSQTRTWIFSIVRNLHLNERRRRRAEKRHGIEVALEVAPPAGGGEPAAPVPGPAATPPEALASVLARERSDLLFWAVTELPDRMGQCVWLRVAQDRKYREIADLLQISINTVKSQLHQATERLRESLAEHFGDVEHLDGGDAP